MLSEDLTGLPQGGLPQGVFGGLCPGVGPQVSPPEGQPPPPPRLAEEWQEWQTAIFSFAT